MLNPCYKTQAHRGPSHSKHAKDTVVCIAGGPSLTRSDVAACERAGFPLLGINNAYQITDKLSHLYACDAKWWHKHYAHTPNCRKFSLEDTEIFDVEKLINDGVEGLSHTWPRVRNGRNSGYQALNLAYLLGYTRIILLGYDMQATDNKIHWHEDHPVNLHNPDSGRMQKWRAYYQGIAQELASVGVKVINASRRTALQCFPQARLEDVL